jgi:integrase
MSVLGKRLGQVVARAAADARTHRRIRQAHRGGPQAEDSQQRPGRARQTAPLRRSPGRAAGGTRGREADPAAGPNPVLSFDEAEAFISAAEESPIWTAQVVVALRTGLGIGELLALRWEDAHLSAGRLLVRRSVWKRVERHRRVGVRVRCPSPTTPSPRSGSIPTAGPTRPWT